jgi:tripartite-type tricarboxylate transporter receptor subunit TctC
MHLHRNGLKAALVVPLLLVPPVLAQSYPSKPIRLIVGFAPGGPNDILARIVGQKLSEATGVPVPVDNRPGADSIIGIQLTARSAPDGYTIATISASSTIHPSVYSNIPFDIAKDLAPVALLASSAFVLVVNPSVPAKSVKDLIALARARPDQLNFASSGIGGTLHLSGELFKSLAHVNMNHVPYKGGAPALNDVISGQLELMFSPMAIAIPQVKSGRLRALAVTSAKRWPSLPDLPSVAEAGVAGYESTGWYGIVAPARTPPETITRLNQEIVKLLALPDVRKRLDGLDMQPIGSSPEQMASHIEAELVKWAKVVRDAKLKPGAIH